MANRLSVISSLNDLTPKLPETAKTQLINALNKSIAILFSGTNLEAIRGCSGSERKAFVEAMSDGLKLPDLKKVSKAWDPKRTVLAGTSFTQLLGELSELMNGEREPFLPPKMSLPDALRLSGQEKAMLADDIARFATAPQLKGLLKKWDKLGLGGDAMKMALPKLRHNLCGLLREDLRPTLPSPKASKPRAKPATKALGRSK